MRVIPERYRTHYIKYLDLYYCHWIDTSAGGLLVSRGYHPLSSERFAIDMAYSLGRCL